MTKQLEQDRSQWKHNFGTRTFEDFNRAFFKIDKQIFADMPTFHYFNKKIILENIRPDTNAEIVLEYNGTIGDYNGYRVTIIHKANGEITNEWFDFKSYLKTEDKVAHSPHVSEHCGIDWWCDGATPNSIKYMIGKINQYIRIYS